MFPLVHGSRHTQPTHYLDPISKMLDRLWEGVDEAPIRRELPPAARADGQRESVLVKAELPGLKPEDIELSVEGNRLTLAVRKKNPLRKGRKLLSE